MNVILYTTHCPKCSVLEKKLSSKNIEYEEVTNVDVMTQKGFNTVPMLEVDGDIMDFKEAFRYLDLF